MRLLFWYALKISLSSQKNAHHYYIEFTSTNPQFWKYQSVQSRSEETMLELEKRREKFEEAKKYFHLVPGRRKHGLFPVVIVVAGNSLYFDYFQL